MTWCCQVSELILGWPTAQHFLVYTESLWKGLDAVMTSESQQLLQHSVKPSTRRKDGHEGSVSCRMQLQKCMCAIVYASCTNVHVNEALAISSSVHFRRHLEGQACNHCLLTCKRALSILPPPEGVSASLSHAVRSCRVSPHF